MTSTAGARWNQVADEYSRGRHVSDVDKRTGTIIANLGPSRVLEIGCGPGTFAEYLLTQLPETISYVGVDVARRFVQITRQRLDKLSGRAISVVQARPGAIIPARLTRRWADVAVAMAVLHHLPRHSLAPALRAIHRSVKPGGHFVLVEDWAFTPSNEVERTALGLRRRLMAAQRVSENHLPEAAWVAMLERQGFEVTARAAARRPLHLERFEALRDRASIEAVQALRRVAVRRRAVPMTILVARVNS